MKTTVLSLSVSATQLEDYILSTSNEKIIYKAHTEWTLGAADRADPSKKDIIKSHLTNNNVELVFITGREENETVYDNSLYLFELGKTYHWNLAFLTHLTVPYGNMRLTTSEDVNKLFVSLIRLPHTHRNLTVDTLAKYELLEKGIYSYLLPFVQGVEQKTNYEFKYWANPRRVTLPSEPNHEHVGDLTVLPDEYWNGFIDLIVESSPDVKFYTEKTLKAILACKPFLIIGAKGINTRLKDVYGFKLYDELFDYSFDQQDNIEDRIELAVRELKKHENSDIKELFEITKEKTIYNLRKLYNWTINNKCGANNIPSELLGNELVRENQVLHYYQQIGYMEILNGR